MQNYQIKSEHIDNILKKKKPQKTEKLKFSWSNWGFGLERLEDSVIRLEKSEIHFIELHGNHYTRDLGYKVSEVRDICRSYGIRVSGVCGMFSRENDLSSSSAWQRQNAIDYIKREVEFCAEVGGEYLLVVPGAVGRPGKYDDSEYERSIEALRTVSELFLKYDVKGAIEPIRSAEVSFIHTINDAKQFIKDLDCQGIKYINGDIYHMQSEETHIGEALLNAEGYLCNLHLADSNRCALGDGSLDIDTVIKALYAIDYDGYVTAEPLGPGGDPYPAMHGKPDHRALDLLVEKTSGYFREREDSVRRAIGL